MELSEKELNAIESILDDLIRGDKANAYIFLMFKEGRVTVMINGSLLGQAIALGFAKQEEQFKTIEAIADQIAKIKTEKEEGKEDETCEQSTETPDNGEI